MPLAKLPASAESSPRIRSISACSWESNTRTSLFASTTAIGSTNTVAPEEEVSCTNPGTSPRHSALTGTTKRPSRIVMIGSCRYFCVTGERTIFSSCSLAREEAERIFLRIVANCGEALSAISSSERIAWLIRSSRYLFGIIASNRSSRILLTPSLLLRQSTIPRKVRRTIEIRSNSPILSVPPASARRREFETSLRPPKDGAPKRAIIVWASSVSVKRRLTCESDVAGRRFTANSAAASQAVSSAKRCNILSSSKAFKCRCTVSLMVVPLYCPRPPFLSSLHAGSIRPNRVLLWRGNQWFHKIRVHAPGRIT